MSDLEIRERLRDEALERHATLIVAARLAARPTRERSPNGQLPPTPRHLEVLTALSNGRTREQAAADLGCGVETIKEHLKRARERLDATTSTQAVAEAIRRGLMP